MARDAADIEPKFVPRDALYPRDNSGGMGYDPMNGEFGDGGKVIGPKAYLSAGSSEGRGRRRRERDSD